MSFDPPAAVPLHAPRKLKMATVSLAGCFGCHMSFLDIDERLLQLLELVEFDRSPLTDIKTIGHCDIGLIEGGLCNAENVHVLREFRANCKTLVAVGACAINGGLPAQRNQLDVGQILRDVYCHSTRYTRSTKWCTWITFSRAALPQGMPSGHFSMT
jgi:NAD-reducing hydrogenase small subunit